MKFAYSTINWGETPNLDSMFRSIEQIGWSAVELFGHSLNWLGTPETLRNRLGSLKVATLFGSFNLPISAEDIEIHKRRVDYAASLGATAYGLVGGGRLRWRNPIPDEYRQLADFCEELSRYAAGRNVIVAYHPHVGTTIETTEEIHQIMALTKELQLCLDLSHVALVGEDPIATMRTFWDRIGYFHLKDWARGRFVELGYGSIGIDFGQILRLIDERGFDGWVVIEQSRSDESPDRSAEINADYVKRLGYAIH